MGNQQSLGGRLSKKDVERLQRRFQRMTKGQNDKVLIPEFQNMVELGGNPFIPHIFKLFDTDNSNSLSMEEFTKALEYFGQLESQEEQYKFAFRIYDQDKDGLISSVELYRTLQILLGTSYPEAQLEQVVHNTMLEFDRDGDNMLSLDEFKMLLSATDLQNKFAFSM